MHVAIIGGASTIGSTFAYALTTYRPDIDITLVDIDADAATGHATDLSHGTYHLANAPTDSASGRIDAIHSEAIDTISPDVAVVTAGGPPPDPADLDRDFRDTRIGPIAAMLDDIAGQLQAIGPLPVINVTNPLDRVTAYFFQRLGWSRSYFIGYALSETARAAAAIGQVADVHPHRVRCPVMGEHGEHMVIVFSQTRVDGAPVDLSPTDREQVIDYVQDVPLQIAEQRGLTESSRWVTSAGLRRLIEHIESEPTTDTLCLSTPLDGEYGFDTGCLSVPVQLGSTGIRDIIEWDLDPAERTRLDTAHRAIGETLPDVDPL